MPPRSTRPGAARARARRAAARRGPARRSGRRRRAATRSARRAAARGDWFARQTGSRPDRYTKRTGRCPGRFSPRARDPPFTDEHETLRDSIRRFVADELRPHAAEWEQARWFPDEVFAGSPRRLPRPEVPRAVRRRGRRLPARGGPRRGARRAAARAGSRRASARTSASPPARLPVRHRRPEAPLPRARHRRREDRRAGHHRARARAPTSRPSRPRAARVDGGFVVNGEKTYITNGVRADFYVTAVKTTAAGRPPRPVLPDRRRRRGRQRVQARQARLARVGHRDRRLPGRLRPRGEPARRGARGLSPDHGQLPVGAAAHGPGRRRRDARRARAHDRLHARAPGLRPAAHRPPGGPPPARRAGHHRAHLPLRDLRRAAPLRRRRGRRCGR